MTNKTMIALAAGIAAGAAATLSIAACAVPAPTPTPTIQAPTAIATTSQPIISTIEHNGVTTTTEWDATSTSTCIYIQHNSGVEYCTSIDDSNGTTKSYEVNY